LQQKGIYSEKCKLALLNRLILLPCLLSLLLGLHFLKFVVVVVVVVVVVTAVVASLQKLSTALM